MAKQYNERIRRRILMDNPWKVVLAITLPLFIYNFVNSIYSVIDAIMLVNIDPSASSAGAILAQVKTLLSSFGMGVSSGGAILISRAYGAGNIAKARKQANVLFTCELVVIGIIIGIFLPFSEPIMRLCGCNDEIVRISGGYFRLQLVELAIICLNNVFVASEKSKGNTKIILYTNIIMMAIKLGLNSIFIYALKVNDMTWIEFASVASQLFMLGIGAFYMFNKNNIFRITPKEFSLKWKYTKPLLVLSLPIFAGKFVISLGKVSVNAICATFIPGDTLLVGALGVSNNICGLVTNPGNAVEDSESGIVSQNLGNKNMRRTMKIFLVSVAYLMAWSVFGFLMVRVFFLDEIASLFITAKQVENTTLYAELIKKVFVYDCLSIPALAINAVILGILYGYGQTFLATLNNVVRIVTRISVLLICRATMDVSTLDSAAMAAGLSMGISNIAIGVFALAMLLIFLIKTKRKGYKGMHWNDPEPKMVEVDGILVREDLVDENGKLIVKEKSA